MNRCFTDIASRARAITKSRETSNTDAALRKPLNAPPASRK